MQKFEQLNLTANTGGMALVQDSDVVSACGIVLDDFIWVALNKSNVLKSFNKNGTSIRAYELDNGATKPTGLAKVPSYIPGGPSLVLVTENGSIQTFSQGMPGALIERIINPYAVYKGVAILNGINYVANLVDFKVEAYDLSTFTQLSNMDIVDVDLRAMNYGPFNIYSDGKQLFISYVLNGGRDDIQGP